MEPLDRWYVLSGYVRFHQWLGCQPYRLENGHVSPFAALTLLQFLAVATNFSLIIYRRECILYHCEWIGMVVDFIKLLTIGLALLVIYVELFRTVDTVCGYWRALYKAHRTLQRQGLVDHKRLARTVRCYWGFLLGTFLYFIWIEWYSYNNAQEMQTKRYYAYFLGLQYLLHIKLQQLIYPAIMLEVHLHMARTALEHHCELLRCSERLGSRRYIEFLAGKINTLKLLHSDLFRASVLLNEAYGKIYLVIYCKSYIHILSNCYWVVFWLLNNQPNHVARIISRLIIRTVLLSVTFYVSSCAMNTNAAFRHRLHTMQLGIQIRSRPLFTMIESFLQQTEMESVKLTAGDCFILNFQPILTIVFTATAYISIFIQQAGYQIDHMECSHIDSQC